MAGRFVASRSALPQPRRTIILPRDREHDLSQLWEAMLYLAIAFNIFHYVGVALKIELKSHEIYAGTKDTGAENVNLGAVIRDLTTVNGRLRVFCTTTGASYELSKRCLQTADRR